MDRILIILKKENGPRASSAPALGLNTIIFKYVYWYMKQISGERLQDHWSSGISGETIMFCTNRQENCLSNFTVFSFFDRKSPDFGKNEGKNSICIQNLTL